MPNDKDFQIEGWMALLSTEAHYFGFYSAPTFILKWQVNFYSVQKKTF